VRNSQVGTRSLVARQLILLDHPLNDFRRFCGTRHLGQKPTQRGQVASRTARERPQGFALCRFRVHMHYSTGIKYRCRESQEVGVSNMAKARQLGPYALNSVVPGDCRKLIADLPDESIDILVTSPPYWGQRMSQGSGVEEDPRAYVDELRTLFSEILPKMKKTGLCWINIGDAYNTPVNWRANDHTYSSLGPDASGLAAHNSAYIKPRHKRKAFIDNDVPWLTYGNLLSLPYRLVIGMCDDGWLSRGEVIWKKRNPMPEGRCRRPQRQHQRIYLFSKDERHSFRTSPPVGSVWEFGSEKIPGLPHFSRFPLELPTRCISAYGLSGSDIVVFDPFSGSGTTGIAALNAGCSYLGFEIDEDQVKASNDRLKSINKISDESISTEEPARRKTKIKGESAHLRNWAQENGFSISVRGRIPRHVEDAYKQASGE